MTPPTQGGNTGYQALREDLKDLRAELATKLEALSQSLIDLARLEGAQHRHGDAIHRIGVQVDSHEQRIRDLEAEVGGNMIRWQMGRWLIVFLMTGASSTFVGIAVGITTYYFTQGGGAQ